MAQVQKPSNNTIVKILMAGNSGAGKTGSLMSLIEAGYKIKMIDLDNGLDALVQLILHKDEKLLSQLDAITLSDPLKPDPVKGLRIDGRPKAYVNTLKYLTKWDDDSTPSEWGSDTVLVIDSLTALGRAAYAWADGMDPNAKDKRQVYFTAQQSVQQVIELLTAAAFNTNVIVISHVAMDEVSEGIFKAYVASIGRALGPVLPRYFNTLILAETRGSGENVKRTIQTMPTSLMDLKNPKPFAVPKALPLETGLATIFHQLKTA